MVSWIWKRNQKSRRKWAYIFLAVVVTLVLFTLVRYTFYPIPLTGKAYEQCRTDADCAASGLRCLQGVCSGCENDQDCPQDHWCNEGGECEFRSRSCQRDVDCSDFQVCENNRCATAEGNSCTSTYQCAAGMLCDTGYCYPLCQDSDRGIDYLTPGIVEYGRWSRSVAEGFPENSHGIVRESRDSCRIGEVLRSGLESLVESLQFEKFCDINGEVASVLMSCQGRKLCVEGQDSCTDVTLTEEGGVCRKDEDCALGLACETNTCQPLPLQTEFGQIVPDTLGRSCQTDYDCQGNVDRPSVVCEDNVCRAGVGSACRTGCSMRYPCITVCSAGEPCSDTFIWDGEPMCGPLMTQSHQTIGEPCRNHDNCISNACINLYYPFSLGRCEERLKGAGQQCFVNNDCKSGDCTQNFCQGNPKYGPCTDNTDCQPNLLCREGLCLNRNVPETTLSEVGCEAFRELLPGHNNLQEDRINLVFVLVNAPEDLMIRQKLVQYINFLSKDALGDNYLFNVEPFKSNKDKFNLWYVNEIQQVSPDASSPTPEPSNRCSILCSNPQERAPSCALENKRTVNVCFMRCKGFAIGGSSQPVYVDTDLNPKGDLTQGAVLTHELGHSVGDLRDEYVKEGEDLHTQFPNCAATRAQADQWWGDLEGVGDGDLRVNYVNGCSYTTENIKPSENSIMNKHSQATGFGIVNYRHLCYQILKKTKKVDISCLATIRAAPRDAYHEMYTKALNEISGGAIADVPKKSAPKPDAPTTTSRQQEQKPTCNQNNRCDKRSGETQFTCPTDCGERVLNLNLRKIMAGVYEIPSYTATQRVPYLPYFEDSGIFEAQLTIQGGRRQLTKYFNLHTPKITETFTDEWTVPPEFRNKEWVMIDDLQQGSVSLDDFQLVYETELSVDVPLGGTPLPNQFRISLTSPGLGISQSFTCQQGTCREEFSK